jgi:glycosyltransferase involved in cell wall biosynthesis
MNPLVTVCTVNYNSADFIEIMLYSLRKLSLMPYKVIIRDNNSSIDDFKKLSKIISDNKFGNVTLYRVCTNLKGSMSHGEALNDLVSRVDTEYTVIMDSDAVFLYRGWDVYLSRNLTADFPLFGAQADTLGNKPKDFPQIFAVFLNTKVLRDLDVDFRPRDISRQEDTGWGMRAKYLSRGLRGKLLYDFNTRFFKGGPFSDIVSAEYYLYPDASGPIFASHFGRGSAPSSKSLLKIKNTKNLFARGVNKILCYPNKVKWLIDKRRWLKTCREIVDKQVNNGK